MSFTGIGKLLKDFVINTLTTNDKTIPGAINELNGNMEVKYNSQYFTYHASTINKNNDVPPVVGRIGNMAFLYLYFRVAITGGTSLIGYIDESIKPLYLIPITVSNANGQAYPMLIHSQLLQIYTDITIPEGDYSLCAMWPCA